MIDPHRGRDTSRQGSDGSRQVGRARRQHEREGVQGEKHAPVPGRGPACPVSNSCIAGADILVAIAGSLGDPVPTDQVSEQAWRATVDANLTATFLTTRSFLPGMLERGHGAIITTASGAGRLPSRSNAAYAAAKAGVMMYTRHLAREMGSRGVRVNCVSPGAVLVPRSPLHRVPKEVRRQAPLT